MITMQMGEHFFYNVLEVQGRDILPPLELKKLTLPMGAGSINSRMKMHNRVIHVRILLEPSLSQSIKEAMREVANRLYTSHKQQRIMFDDDPTICFLGTCTNIIVLKENPYFCEYRATLDCFPLAESFIPTIYKNIDGVTLMNSGTYKSHGTLNFTIPDGAATMQFIGLFGTVAKVVLSTSVSGALTGAWEVDMKNRLVKRNNVLEMAKINFELTRWTAPMEEEFCVPPGEFLFYTSTGISNLNLVYKRRWL